MRVGAFAPLAQTQSSCSSWSESSSPHPTPTTWDPQHLLPTRLPWRLLRPPWRPAPSRHMGLSPTAPLRGQLPDPPPWDAPAPLLLYYVTLISLFHITSFLKSYWSTAALGLCSFAGTTPRCVHRLQVLWLQQLQLADPRASGLQQLWNLGSAVCSSRVLELGFSNCGTRA